MTLWTGLARAGETCVETQRHLRDALSRMQSLWSIEWCVEGRTRWVFGQKRMDRLLNGFTRRLMHRIQVVPNASRESNDEGMELQVICAFTSELVGADVGAFQRALNGWIDAMSYWEEATRTMRRDWQLGIDVPGHVWEGEIERPPLLSTLKKRLEQVGDAREVSGGDVCGVVSGMECLP